MERNADVVIIGGGSTGTSILYQLAKKGLTNSILIERGEVASGQTSRSTALVRTHYSDPTVAKMALLSYQYFQNFERQVNGESCGFKQTGLLVCADPLTERGLRENIAMFEELGIDSRIVDDTETRKIEPHLETEIFSLIEYEPQAGYAEPSITANSFARSAQKLGSNILRYTEARAIEKGNGSFRYSVQTSHGTIYADKVVIATGVYSKPLLGRLGVKNVPLKCVRHPVAIFRRPEEYSGTRPLIFDFPRKSYYKPEGRYLFFAGSLEPELDLKEIDPENYNQDVSFDEIAKYSQDLSEVLPILSAKGEYKSSYTGVYDMTPDQQPIIDEFESDGYPGVFCLLGLSGHGFKLCPEFGRIMSRLIIDGKFSDYDISIFARSRFERGGRVFSSRYPLSTVA